MKHRAIQFAPLITAGLLAGAGCGLTGGDLLPINPFQTYSEQFGATASSTSDATAGSGSTAGDTGTVFRQGMNISFENRSTVGELETSFMAWVEVSSITSAEQQDALIDDGYVQLSRSLDIGAAFTLPPGTFVYGGGGTGGATRILLQPAETEDLELLTPDAILVFLEPPTSCENVAFLFREEGRVIEGFQLADGFAVFAGATSVSGRKTLAQIDAYQCSPFEPGLFLRRTGGVAQSNEFSEGAAVTFGFQLAPDEAGVAGFVTIGAN